MPSSPVLRLSGPLTTEVRFTPPRPGVYYVFVQSRSQGLAFNGSPYVTLMATGASGAEAESVEARNSHEE